MLHKLRLLLCFVACTLLLNGCNTVRGMGKDIEKGGEAIQRATH